MSTENKYSYTDFACAQLVTRNPTGHCYPDYPAGISAWHPGCLRRLWFT